jgi:signal transduction histidine kinase
MYRAERLATAGELAAGAAHEIRNPLAAVRSAIQYLRSDYAEGSARASLVDDLLSEVDRIDGIVEGLLSFARPPVSRPEPVELPELLGQSVALVAVRARSQRVSVTLDAPPSLAFHADPNQLKQVLLNVLLNALQAMPDGGELRVAAAPRGRSVEIRVADTGSGIPPEHVDRVFDPFFTTRPEGTGLGLSICYGIVERHGGEMEVRSEAGRGTEMVVRLPRRQGA